jgi:hypothetical protein
MKLKIAVTASVGLVLGIALVACVGERMEGIVADPELKLAPGEKAPPVEEPLGEGLVVKNWEWKTERSLFFSQRCLVGTVVNNTDFEMSSVYVEFNLYDDSGVLIDNTCNGVDSLEPRTAWKFRAWVLDDRVAEARLKDVHGWYSKE